MPGGMLAGGRRLGAREDQGKEQWAGRAQVSRARQLQACIGCGIWILGESMATYLRRAVVEVVVACAVDVTGLSVSPG